MGSHTLHDLRQMQALPLSIKIRMTEQRVRDWIYEFGEDGVYISFSGGKDSTVLLDIIRNQMGLKNIRAVFFDTGLEYPEIRDFVKKYDNVDWVKPSMSFKQVIDNKGYPFVSKEVGRAIRIGRKFITNPEQYKDKKPLKNQKEGESYKPYDYMKLTGTLKGKDGEKSMFNCSKWAFMLDAPFDVSEQCCDVMKKKPAKEYSRKTGRMPIVATMAEESRLRLAVWLSHGCNSFEGHIISSPMAFWTEQDVLQYIVEHNLEIASVYGSVVRETNDDFENQMTFEDFGLLNETRKLKTTGLNRTGCMFCGFGCHLDPSPNRFELMKKSHPKLYDYIMRPKDKGGLNYKEVIDWINEHGNLNIRY